MSPPLHDALRLGVATGLRSTAGWAILLRSSRMPRGSPLTSAAVRRGVEAALLGEAVADKTGLLPPRTDPVPLAGRVLLGGAAAVLVASWNGSSRPAAWAVGAAGAAATAWLATTIRAKARERGVPDAVPALFEDLVVVALGGGADVGRA